MFIWLLAASVVFQILLFVPAFVAKTDKLTDFAYSLGFVIVSSIVFSRFETNTYKAILLSMIVAWALRLGAYLVFRIAKTGKDKRFDEIRINFWKFLQFWVFQGVVIPLILLPSIYFFGNSTNYSPLLLIGGLIWFAGLFIEGLSDIQKFVFKSDSKNKGKWIDTGLWKYSRHPNYLGEIMCWVGIYLYTFSSLSDLQKIYGLISPLVITTLLVFISGIPILEKKADERWGKDKAYQKYKKNTSVLVPFIY